MSRSIISVENLSKAYRIGLKEEIPDTMMSALIGAIKAPLRNFRRLSRLDAARASDVEADTLWALKDVSFDVQEGEVLGIIGRNGAGKSTLLKILSRITEPTAGRIVMRGRVSSLLEVGTGFHPELTGRENVYMNGTILGMKKREIDRKFGEIVDFSGVEKFLDTPVKRYSSGMQVRLAFAVAAHLEPEILIVDEVLAVGDADFQRKCLGKMQDVAVRGRTVLFVSHNMDSVRRLCNRAVVVQDGIIGFDGKTQSGIDAHLSASTVNATHGNWIDLDPIVGRGDQRSRFKRMRYSGENANRPITSGKRASFDLIIESDATRRISSLAVTLYDAYGVKLVNADTLLLGRTIEVNPGENSLSLSVEALHLTPGRYVLGLWLANPPHVHHQIDQVLYFDVEGEMMNGFGTRPQMDGVVSCVFKVLVRGALG